MSCADAAHVDSMLHDGSAELLTSEGFTICFLLLCRVCSSLKISHSSVQSLGVGLSYGQVLIILRPHPASRSGSLLHTQLLEIVAKLHHLHQRS